MWRDALEFKHFKYIVAIAEAGTFTAAAIHLPLAQSALSRQISEIVRILMSATPVDSRTGLQKARALAQ